MILKLIITPETLDQLTWDQWELFDTIGEKPNYRKLREIIALFVDGKDFDSAMIDLGKLKTSEMKSVMDQFTKKIGELGTANPPKDGS